MNQQHIQLGAVVGIEVFLLARQHVAALAGLGIDHQGERLVQRRLHDDGSCHLAIGRLQAALAELGVDTHLRGYAPMRIPRVSVRPTGGSVLVLHRDSRGAFFGRDHDRGVDREFR